MRKLENRRVPNGTHGGVRGRGNPPTRCAPGMGALLWVKVPRPPGSGKVIAKVKGVHREVESEGRWRQISGLTNRNHIRLSKMDKVAEQTEVQ